MQAAGGARPGGLVADEFQEWFRFRVLPAVWKICQEQFIEGVNDWFEKKLYQDLCCAVGHEPGNVMEPMFLISLDSDPRHSMKDLGRHSNKLTPKGSLVDRRTLSVGEVGYIPIDPIKNYVPTAPKVPDCLQCPIEMSFSPVKRHFRGIVHEPEYKGERGMVRAMQEAFQLKHTADRIKNCFTHGELAMRVFSGREDEVVVQGDTCYHCTFGKWVPRKVAG